MLGGMQTLCKYVRIACLCVELLLQSEAGEEFLKQHGLVRKVAELFRDELDGVPPPLSPSSSGLDPTPSHLPCRNRRLASSQKTGWSS